MKKANLIGRKYGRLTVMEFSHSNKGAIWKCRCECGNMTYAKTAALKNGHKKSCGCLCDETRVEVSTKHGLCHTPTYTTWDSMIQRCNNPNNENYHRYGGRGISVCDRWLKFENFIEDIGLRPPRFTLDRIDNDKGYFKENCRWISQKRQSNNTSRNVKITYDGETHSLSEWAEKLHIHKGTLRNRIFRSQWPVEKAFFKEVLR